MKLVINNKLFLEGIKAVQSITDTKTNKSDKLKSINFNYNNYILSIRGITQVQSINYNIQLNTNDNTPEPADFTLDTFNINLLINLISNKNNLYGDLILSDADNQKEIKATTTLGDLTLKKALDPLDYAHLFNNTIKNNDINNNDYFIIRADNLNNIIKASKQLKSDLIKIIPHLEADHHFLRYEILSEDQDEIHADGVLCKVKRRDN